MMLLVVVVLLLPNDFVAQTRIRSGKKESKKSKLQEEKKVVWIAPSNSFNYNFFILLFRIIKFTVKFACKPNSISRQRDIDELWWTILRRENIPWC